MSQSLPTHGFRFLPEEEISALKLQDLSDDGEEGYILEVDIHYSTNYLLAPESLVIGHSVYSPTQQSIFPESASQTKLTPNLRDNVKYVVHYRNLKLYLQLDTYRDPSFGLKLCNICRECNYFGMDSHKTIFVIHLLVCKLFMSFHSLGSQVEIPSRSNSRSTFGLMQGSLEQRRTPKC